MLGYYEQNQQQADRQHRYNTLKGQLKNAHQIQEKYWQFMYSQPCITVDMVKRYVSYCCEVTRLETELKYH